MNYQFVNNPLQGRCEFLGYYCKHGDYINGCAESHFPTCNIIVYNNIATILMNRTSSGLDNTYGTPTDIIQDPFI